MILNPNVRNHSRRKPGRLKSQPAVMKIQNYHISLPEELIEEILARLPVESLLRFKSVSKSWRSLIGSKSFVKLHHKSSMKNPSFPRQRVMVHTSIYDDRIKYCSVQSLLDKPSIHPSSSYDPPHDQSKPFQVVGCYNGLVCILEDSRNFFLWNPSTKISKRLPEIADRGHVLIYGFGWIESSEECRVFGIVFDRYDRSRMGKVYSSKTNSWKTVGKWDLNVPKSSEGVFVGGKLYWKREMDIVLVDLKREVLGSVELPSDKDLSFNYGMGELGGCLCLLYHERDHNQRGVRVWVMKDYSWERVMTLSHVLELLERPFSAPYTVGPNGEITVFYGSTFLVYYPQHRIFRCPNICYNNYDSLHLFAESLVWPLQLDV